MCGLYLEIACKKFGCLDNIKKRSTTWHKLKPRYKDKAKYWDSFLTSFSCEFRYSGKTILCLYVSLFNLWFNFLC